MVRQEKEDVEEFGEALVLLKESSSSDTDKKEFCSKIKRFYNPLEVIEPREYEGIVWREFIMPTMRKQAGCIDSKGDGKFESCSRDANERLEYIKDRFNLELLDESLKSCDIDTKESRKILDSFKDAVDKHGKPYALTKRCNKC